MLRNESIARRLQLTMDDLNALLQGSVTPAVAGRLDVRRIDLQLFVEGQPTERIVRFLRMESVDAAYEFSMSLGKDGAIGMIFGLLMSAQVPAVDGTPVPRVASEGTGEF